jgi:hypothetical protein
MTTVAQGAELPNPFFLEMNCAEHNGDLFGKNLFPILHVERRDF